MNSFKRLVLVMLIASIGLGVSVSEWSQPTSAASANLQAGSQNGDVWDAQFRLKVLGYYQQPIDGVYGPVTAAAVRNFQYNYGLTIDGIVGANTWQSLRKYSVNQEDLDMLAKVIYSEARGESYTGQVAVGAVVMNRLKSSNFPNTIEGIVFESGAFTAVDDGQYWLTPDSTAYQAAQDAVRGWDPTGGALYYFNPETATSKWIWSRPQTVKIGNHIFAK
ncbi:spore cortex-lytic enzyme [Paenibacillus aceris]|uniref:Spore cortex-lytic enzyme n=1 Tax=Paenibacillus aceris TaxID=869555 RepID=A0ABS4I143_9BACL|nr:spore cortex-lytic enzyme [Paenibacillus aceris]MBP1964636.1 N-acetylmuramoyl-L-alanine amidase [Paenibacillus aceris]NHW33625.1 spore cortex-lytic enzyme [Paenibacillus aceris]